MRTRKTRSRNPLVKAGKVAPIGPPAAIGGASALMFLLTELHSKKVWATKEEREMRLPGDDLVPDPDMRITQAKDLDAPLEEVWKHVHQLDPEKGGMYSRSNLERMFGMNVDNACPILEMWQRSDAVKPGDLWACSHAGFRAEVADVVEEKCIV